MSAWIVSAHHIDALAEAATRHSPWGLLTYRYGGDFRTCADPNEVGRILLAECVKSVRYRYPHDRDDALPGWKVRPATYRYRAPAEYSAIALLKAIDCYEYQSCEHPEWRASEAFAICAALRKRLIGKLPGYGTAPWGIDDEERKPVPIPFSS